MIVSKNKLNQLKNALPDIVYEEMCSSFDEPQLVYNIMNHIILNYNINLNAKEIRLLCNKFLKSPVSKFMYDLIKVWQYFSKITKINGDIISKTLSDILTTLARKYELETLYFLIYDSIYEKYGELVSGITKQDIINCCKNL